MSWFSAGNLFGSLGFHDTPKPAPAPAAPDPAIAASQAAALQATQDALALAQQSSTPPQDSESARAASDDQRRKLMNGSSFGIGLATRLGAAPVGFRMLSGQ